MSRVLQVVKDADTLADAAAELFAARAERAAAHSGRFAVALSGGTTPRPVFERLAADPYHRRVPWERTHLFWADERMVPPDHPDSNYRLVEQTLLPQVSLPPENLHRIEAERGAQEAADRYEAHLREFFGLGSGTVPHFDLVLLGMGTDGHTASLFPGSRALDQTARLVAAPWVESLGTHRVTLTLPVINAAECVLMLVSGPDKAAALARVLGAGTEASAYPAARVHPRSGSLVWLVDEAAAQTLPQFRPDPESAR